MGLSLVITIRGIGLEGLKRFKHGKDVRGTVTWGYGVRAARRGALSRFVAMPSACLPLRCSFLVTGRATFLLKSPAAFQGT